MKKNYFFLFLFAISFIGNAQQLEYKDVAGIFYNRCTSCHHQNQHAQSMMNYSETYPWVGAIQADVTSGHMPPWPADTLHKRFFHERILTASEKTAILSWINTGAQKGDTTKAPPSPKYTSNYVLKGKPDLILKVPAFKSNASTKDTYNCFSLPTGLTKDRILRAMEIVPNNPAILHHSVVNVDTTGTVKTDTSGGAFLEPGDFMIGGYVPGLPATVMPGKAPLKCGILIKAGSNIITQQHYPLGSAGLMDSTEIRIYFYPEGTTGVRPVHVATLLKNWLMTIPANTVKTFTAEYPSIMQPAIPGWSIMGVNPHAHHVNVSMFVCAYKASPKDTIPLINIPKWDFNWQGAYTFRNLVKVPAGYKLYARHVYDNTTNNPDNPNNPPQSVSAGTNTTDEMLFDSFAWLNYKAGDDTINISNILEHDSLIDNPTLVNEITTNQITSYTFPNPFNESTTLIVTNQRAADCKLQLFDIYGNEVSAEVQRLSDAFIIRRGNLTSGVYFYSLSDGKSSGSGKLVLTPNK